MIEPATPPDEARRLASLHALEILGTPAEERFDRITRMARNVFGTPFAVVSLVDSARQWFKSCQGLGASETPRSVSFCGHTILSEAPLIVPDATLDPRFVNNPLVTGPPNIRFYAGQPIHAADGSRIGTLCVIGDEARDGLSETELEALHDLAGWVESELSVKRLSATQIKLNSELGAARRQALTDSLTRLWNREGILRVLDAELKTARAAAADVGVLMLDLDWFKRVNDTHGHSVGDRVLQESARRMRAAVRPCDAVGRYGGEEFLCVIQGADTDSCLRAAERIRRRIASSPYRVADQDRTIEFSVTMSIGVTNTVDRVFDAATLIDAADAALYRAKHAGRNRVEMAKNDTKAAA